MVFTLTDIPRAMRQEGWPVGAAVMERWFAGAGRIMPTAEKEGRSPQRDVEARLVTLGWCRRFARFTAAENELLGTWSSAARLNAARANLADKVRAWRWRTGAAGAFRFGDLAAGPARADQTCQLNFQRIESALFGDVDDFYAAIGRGSVKIAVAGDAVPLPDGRIRLTIDEVGTYLRDTYDFNGDQMLGSWGPTGLSRAAVFAPDIQVVRETARNGGNGVFAQRYWSVGNASFRDWRNHYGRGGDFTIYSGIGRRRLLRPVIMEFAA
ncbi:DUF6402 family protein [Sphingomonas hankookensis]